MKALNDLVAAWNGLAMMVVGDPAAKTAFNTTRLGLLIALFWFVVALLASTAALSVETGLPAIEPVVIGFFIQAVTIGVLALAIVQSLSFLKIEVPLRALLVPIVYFVALAQIIAIPLNMLGSNIQLLAMLGLVLLIWRAGRVLGGMNHGVAIAFALLCLMVLVAVPNALYMVFLQIPSPT